MTPILIIFLALLLIAALLIVSCGGVARLWCRPVRKPPRETPENHDLPFESVRFFSRGVSMSGWFIPCRLATVPAPIIILVHGWSANAAQLLPVGRSLFDAGFAVLLYDARGHGASGKDGPITIRKFAEDITAAVGYLEGRPDVDKAKIGVLGTSMGGSAAILAASWNDRIRALVSCSAFADPEWLTTNYLGRLHMPAWPCRCLVSRFIERWLGAPMSDFAPRNAVSQISIPLLLIHGEKDRYVSPSDMDSIYAQAPAERAERLLIPDSSHSGVIRDTRGERAIVEFLGRTIHGQ